MAQKDLTYLRFDGSSTSRRGDTSGSWYGEAGDTSFVFTIFARLLEWPAGCAPIIQQHTGGTGTDAQWGLFWYNNNFARSSRGPQGETGDDLCLGIQWQPSSGGVVEEIVSVEDTTGVPAKLGNIYQIQLAVREDGSTLRVAVFIDGVSVHQTSISGGIPTADGAEVVRLGYGSLDGFDGKLTNEERAPMDVIQLMYERNRTLTLTGTDIDPPDSALDPWEELAVDGSATGQAFHLDEGTGSPSGFQFTNPNWADETKIDPQIDEDAGDINWTFENIFGYSEGKPDAYPQPVFAPVGDRTDPTAGELRLRLRPCIWSEHGQLDSDQWTSTYGLASSAAQAAVDGESALGSVATAGNSASNSQVSDHGGAAADGQGRWWRVWHYDKGGTSSNIINRIQITGGDANWVGVLFSQSLTNYYTRVGTLGTADTGVTRSVGWHEWVMYIQEGIIGNEQCRIWLDGTMVRSENASNCGANNVQTDTRIRTTVAADQFHVDWWHWNREDGDTPAEFQGLVVDTATVVLPAAQPAGNVVSFDSVTIVDEDAGSNSMEVGTLTYEFRHDDGGGFGSWTALTNGNLQALTPGGGGQDVIEVRVTLDSGMDDCASPAVRSINIAYTSGIIPRIIHHRRQMAGVC